MTNNIENKEEKIVGCTSLEPIPIIGKNKDGSPIFAETAKQSAMVYAGASRSVLIALSK